MSNEAISIPDLGGAEAIEVVEVPVKAGDSVQVDDILLVLESDKASMEIPSPQAGVLVSIDVKVGDTVAEGDVFAHIETSAAESEKPSEEVSASGEDSPSPAAPLKDADQVKDAAPVKEAAPVSDAPTKEAVAINIAVPEIGDAGDVEVIELSVKVGDSLAPGDTMLVLESDKASMEVPAPVGGEILEVFLKLGDKVSEGSDILRLLPEVAVEAPPSQPEASQSEAPAEAPSPITAEEQLAPVREPSSTLVHAGPAVRKLAREFGVELAQINGTGPYGRLLKEDVQAFVKEQLGKSTTGSGLAIEPIPEIDFARFGTIRVEPMTSVQKLTAVNMHRSWLNVPRVSQFDEIDVTALEKFRAGMKPEIDGQDVKLTPLPFLLLACAGALRKNPLFNASLHADGQHIVYKDYVHIGIAVDTPVGLMVPVIRDVDSKGLLELARETAELAALARERKLKPEQMQGGCFTISSLGNIGGTGFTPIINAPELAILGVSRLSVKPVWNGKKFKPRKMLPLTLAYDHRAINGAVAGRFMQDLGAILADVRRLLL